MRSDSSLDSRNLEMCCPPRSFCFGCALKVGAICAALYTLSLSVVGMVKSAIWVVMLQRGLVPQVGHLSTPYIFEIQWIMTNITQDTEIFVHQSFAKNAVAIVWNSGGLVTSCLLLSGLKKHKSVYLLPWLSWSCVTFIVVTLNVILEAIIWILYDVVGNDAFTLFHYLSLPIAAYFITIVIALYNKMNDGPSLMKLAAGRSWRVPGDQSKNTTSSTNGSSQTQGCIVGNLCCDSTTTNNNNNKEPAVPESRKPSSYRRPGLPVIVVTEPAANDPTSPLNVICL